MRSPRGRQDTSGALPIYSPQDGPREKRLEMYANATLENARLLARRHAGRVHVVDVKGIQKWWDETIVPWGASRYDGTLGRNASGQSRNEKPTNAPKCTTSIGGEGYPVSKCFKKWFECEMAAKNAKNAQKAMKVMR